ncbi:MAG: A/G-specific adenine glycosylase [Prevotellaceae bacterium]|jgi:A/G-specific adenine glycosylase|nr:A/G-specific adenine glycosylase [Prevotellaceae bacterium]
MNISNTLIIWFNEHKRELPWKSDRDPYKIWISEIILQQTRVEQAKSYFLMFVSEFPTVQSLAKAPLDAVLRMWQGLGYYSRARYMHEAAKQVVTQFGGLFPRTANDLSKLKGVGPYTAAAIASFAFDDPVVALDGNGFRIFSRLFAQSTPIHTSEARKIFSSLAHSCLNLNPSSIFNQAIMDFGSLVCTPYPKCNDCPLTDYCIAFAQNKQTEFPVKRAKIEVKRRFFYFLHISHQNHTFIQQRLKNDIWQNLYQFPLIETQKDVPVEDLPNYPEWASIFDIHEPRIIGFSQQYVHRLTHQVLYTYFIRILIEKESIWLHNNCIKISAASIDLYGIPRLVERYLLDESTNHLSL